MMFDANANSVERIELPNINDYSQSLQKIELTSNDQPNSKGNHSPFTTPFKFFEVGVNNNEETSQNF